MAEKKWPHQSTNHANNAVTNDMWCRVDRLKTIAHINLMHSEFTRFEPIHVPNCTSQFQCRSHSVEIEQILPHYLYPTQYGIFYIKRKEQRNHFSSVVFVTIETKLKLTLTFAHAFQRLCSKVAWLFECSFVDEKGATFSDSPGSDFRSMI